MSELTEGIEALSERRNISEKDLLGCCRAIIDKQVDEILRLKGARDKMLEEFHEIEQILGKALGYPFCKTAQKNYFPDGSESDGVCIGDNNAVSLTNEAAKRIEYLEDERMEHISLN